MRDIGSFELTVDVRRHRSVIPHCEAHFTEKKIMRKGTQAWLGEREVLFCLSGARLQARFTSMHLEPLGRVWTGSGMIMMMISLTSTIWSTC